MTQQPPPRPPQWAGPGGRPAAPGQPPHYAAYPPGSPMPPQPPSPPKPLTRKWWFWVIVALVGLGVLGRCTEANRSAAPGPVASTGSAVQSVTPSPATSSAAPAAAATVPSAPQPTAPPAPASLPAAAPTTEARVGLNTPVTDRDLEFTVTGFACGVTVKDAFQSLEPQGKFCRIRLTAKNVGSRQTTLSDDQVFLEDAGGAQYSASTDTWLVEGSMFLKAINPGNTLTGVVVIDVPKAVTPTTAVLRAGTYSRGARVSLPRT